MVTWDKLFQAIAPLMVAGLVGYEAHSYNLGIAALLSLQVITAAVRTGKRD